MNKPAIQNEHKSRGQKRRGIVTVEFAIIVPVIFVLFFAALEMTWVNMMRNSVANAAYEAARKAAIPGATADQAEQVARRTLDPLKMSNGMSFSMTDFGDQVEVTIDVPVADNSWGMTRFSGGLRMTKTIRLSKE